MKLPEFPIAQNPPPHSIEAQQRNAYLSQHQYLHHEQQSSNYNVNNGNGYQWAGYQDQWNGGQQYQPQVPQGVVTSPQGDPFAEYAWMVDADEFDKQMMEQMEQEEYFETCIQEMWQDEDNDGDWFYPPQESGSNQNQTPVENLDKLTIEERPQPTMLNPNAAEFVPRSAAVRQ